MFIVTTVCRNKSRLRKKYDTKKSIPSSTSQQGPSVADGSPPKVSQRPIKALKFEQSSADGNSVDEVKHDVYVSVRGSQVMNSLLERQRKWTPVIALCQALLVAERRREGSRDSQANGDIFQSSFFFCFAPIAKKDEW